MRNKLIAATELAELAARALAEDLGHGEGVGEGNGPQHARAAQVPREQAQMELGAQPEEQQDPDLARPAQQLVAMGMKPGHQSSSPETSSSCSRMRSVLSRQPVSGELSPGPKSRLISGFSVHPKR